MRAARTRLTAEQRDEASAAAPSTPIEKLFALQAVLADRRTSKTEATVLGVLIEATNKAQGYAWPALGSIAAAAGIGKRATINALHKLENYGYVIIDEGGGRGVTNRYYVRAERVHDDAPLRVNERAPLSLLRRPEESEQKGEPISQKGEPIGTKGCTVTTETVHGGAPDPLLEPSYDPPNLNPSAPAASTQSADATRESRRGQNREDERATTDPLAQLPNNPGAFLAIAERRVKNGPLPSSNETAAWREASEALVDEHGTSDPDIGGWAERVVELLADHDEDSRQAGGRGQAIEGEVHRLTRADPQPTHEFRSREEQLRLLRQAGGDS